MSVPLRTIIFEPNGTGHRVEYVRHLVEARLGPLEVVLSSQGRYLSTDLEWLWAQPGVIVSWIDHGAGPDAVRALADRKDVSNVIVPDGDWILRRESLSEVCRALEGQHWTLLIMRPPRLLGVSPRYAMSSVAKLARSVSALRRGIAVAFLASPHWPLGTATRIVVKSTVARKVIDPAIPSLSSGCNDGVVRAFGFAHRSSRFQSTVISAAEVLSRSYESVPLDVFGATAELARMFPANEPPIACERWLDHTSFDERLGAAGSVLVEPKDLLSTGILNRAVASGVPVVAMIRGRVARLLLARHVPNQVRVVGLNAAAVMDAVNLAQGSVGDSRCSLRIPDDAPAEFAAALFTLAKDNAPPVGGHSYPS